MSNLKKIMIPCDYHHEYFIIIIYLVVKINNFNYCRQQKCKTRNDQMLALYYSDYATKNSKNDSGSIESIQLIIDLRQEIAELERKNKDLMEQQQEQIKNLELKNEMITYLKREHTEGNNTNTHQVK